MFTLADRDRSGNLDFNEMMQVAQTFGFTEEDVRGLVTKYDFDKNSQLSDVETGCSFFEMFNPGQRCVFTPADWDSGSGNGGDTTNGGDTDGTTGGDTTGPNDGTNEPVEEPAEDPDSWCEGTVFINYFKQEECCIGKPYWIQSWGSDNCCKSEHTLIYNSMYNNHYCCRNGAYWDDYWKDWWCN